LNWSARDLVLTGNVDPRASWCEDKVACAERWLRKFLSGKSIVLQSLTMIGHGPERRGVFEAVHTRNGSPEAVSRVLMPEVRDGGDQHRRSEHYHVIEFGKDVTDSF
jgi:hypothetical protein